LAKGSSEMSARVQYAFALALTFAICGFIALAGYLY
jgi:hypothetical protein